MVLMQPETILTRDLNWTASNLALTDILNRLSLSGLYLVLGVKKIFLFLYVISTISKPLMYSEKVHNDWVPRAQQERFLVQGSCGLIGSSQGKV